MRRAVVSPIRAFCGWPTFSDANRHLADENRLLIAKRTSRRSPCGDIFFGLPETGLLSTVPVIYKEKWKPNGLQS